MIPWFVLMTFCWYGIRAASQLPPVAERDAGEMRGLFEYQAIADGG